MTTEDGRPQGEVMTSDTPSLDKLDKKYALVIGQNAKELEPLIEALSAYSLPNAVFESMDAAIKHLVKMPEPVPCVIFLESQAPWLEGLAMIKYVKLYPQAATVPQLRFLLESGNVYVNEARTLGAMGSRPTCFERIAFAEMLDNLGFASNGSQASVSNLESTPVEQLDATEKGCLDEAQGGSCESEGSGKRLINSSSFQHLVNVSASNDAQSFREHATVVSYLRSLETSMLEPGQGNKRGKRRSDGAQDLPQRTGLWHLNEDDEAFDGSFGGYGRWLHRGSSTHPMVRSELEQTLERVQQQVEFDMIRQTGTLQDSFGMMMDAQCEAIDRQFSLSRRELRMDRWLRIVFFSLLLISICLWLVTQVYQLRFEQSANFFQGHTLVDSAHSSRTAAVFASVAEPEVRHNSTERAGFATERLLENIQAMLNQQPPVAFGVTALDAQQAARLGYALESLAAVGFEGVVEVTSHVSPYCVTYDAMGKAVLPVENMALATCQLLPESSVQARAGAEQQSIEFANIVARYNYDGSPLRVVVTSSVNEEDFDLQAFFSDTEPSKQNGSTQWNELAKQGNRVSYRITQ